MIYAGTSYKHRSASPSSSPIWSASGSGIATATHILYPNLWTEKAREAVASAQNLAEERHNPQVEPEHLLLALERQQQGVVSRIPQRLNADPRAIAAAARVIYLTARCTWHALCETSR